MEQNNEWSSTVYANFIDFTKAFDSVNRLTLRRILGHYGIPDKLVSIIKMLYSNYRARVICGKDLTDDFAMRTGGKTRLCALSSSLFSLYRLAYQESNRERQKRNNMDPNGHL